MLEPAVWPRSSRASAAAGQVAMDAHRATENVSDAIQLTGLAVLVAGVGVTLVHSALKLLAARRGDLAYQTLRRDLGKSILLGLEFLVAADILRSITIAPTFQSVGVLGLIVLVRTLLSWSLELEVSGAWPWQRSRARPRTCGTDEG
jgi:uncharacterized membrane protein